MKKKTYEMFLINPKIKYHHYGVQKELGNILGKKIFNFSMALPLVAGLTPDNYKIRIIDESSDPIPKNKKPDLVGLTTFTSTKKRCFEIADYYRAQGVPVIIGGAHSTFETEETLKHADSVIIGEVELIWKDVLNDFENGKLKSTYKADRLCDFITSPMPKWNSVKAEDINIIGVQATRGCPFRCDFCLVAKVFGTKHRRRDVDDVINEIKSLPLKRLFFVDDNLTFNKPYIRELIKKIKPLKVSWACNSSIEIGEDTDLLKEMSDSGCISIFIGFESLSMENIKDSKKDQNEVADYERLINNIHSSGINIIASFVVGFDHDTLESYDRILEFSIKCNLLFTNIYFLLPVPGSDLANRLKEENRLINIDPDFLNANFPALKYKNFKCIDMFDKYYQTIKKLFSFEVMSKKILALLESGKFTRTGSKDIGFIEKIKTSIFFLKRFNFTKDEMKKEFFKKAFMLGRKGIASYDSVAYQLLALCGFEDYIAYYEGVYTEVRDEVVKFDKL